MCAKEASEGGENGCLCRHSIGVPWYSIRSQEWEKAIMAAICFMARASSSSEMQKARDINISIAMGMATF